MDNYPMLQSWLQNSPINNKIVHYKICEMSSLK